MAETGGKSLRSAGEPPGITNHVAPDAFVRGNLRIEPRRTNASATTHSDQVPTKDRCMGKTNSGGSMRLCDYCADQWDEDYADDDEKSAST